MILNKCVAVILAGGKSSRMGQPKGLLDFNGVYWLLEQLKRLKSGGITTVYIGLGYDYKDYFKAIPFLAEAQNGSTNWEELSISAVLNQTPELGSFSTLKNVLQVIPKNKDVLIVPIDVPVLNKTALQNLLKQEGSIIKPQCQGKTGHPIILRKDVVAKLLCEPSPTRLDNYISNMPNTILSPCDDFQITMNINTPSVWESYKTAYSYKTI